jgi:hypothetical protein
MVEILGEERPGARPWGDASMSGAVLANGNLADRH